MADDVVRDPSDFLPTGVPLGDHFNFEKVSWGAIWAGVAVTIGMEALFLSFGVFIDAVLGGSTNWAMAWYLVTMAVSFSVGARAAARLSDVSVRQISILHGLATWGLATLATVLIGGLVLWAFLYMRSTAVAVGATPVSAPAAWGAIEMYGGVIWGGVVLSLLGAFFGGISGLPTRIAATAPRPVQRTI